MSWLAYGGLGSVGGVIVEALALFKWMTAWQDARRAPDGTVSPEPAPFTAYVDVRAHIGVLLLRGALGFASSAIFALGGQISGGYVAVALGFAGPALLGRLGQIPQLGDRTADGSDAQVPPDETSAALPGARVETISKETADE